MGYITLTVKKHNETKEYILFHADYLNEAWLAKVNDDDTTKIIKQFRCRKFEQCFHDAVHLISQLGEVTKISSSEIDELHISMFRYSLEKQPFGFPAFPEIANLKLVIAAQNLKNKFAGFIPKFTFAN